MIMVLVEDSILNASIWRPGMGSGGSIYGRVCGHAQHKTCNCTCANFAFGSLVSSDNCPNHLSTKMAVP